MIYGISKIRNEEAIIEDTINHYLQWCEKLVIYDDDSTDRTKEIMKKFDRVIVIDGHPFSTERRDLQEMVHRNIAMSRAREDNPEWIIIFDADERIYEMPEDLEGIDAVEMKFFDAYITPVDVLMPYYQREYFGIEYRRIINMVRTSALKEIAFPARIHERVPDIKEGSCILVDGIVKHYGKAVSVEEWEKTCDYYSHDWPESYKKKWAARKGKAIHIQTGDFGLPIMHWDKLMKDKDIWQLIY